MNERQPAASGYAAVNGINMYYEIYGKGGVNLLLVHGGGSTIETTFGRLIPLLADHLKIIAVELQGHGRTNDREGPESFEQDAEDCIALLQQIGIAKTAVLGFSNGGNTAMQMAHKQPALIDKLILASTFYKREGLPQGFFDGMAQATIEVMPQALKDGFLKWTPDEQKLQTMFEKDRSRMLHFEDWENSILTSITMPTLIVNGDQDVITTAHSVQMQQLVKGSRLLILPSVHGSYMGAAESPPDKGYVLSYFAAMVNDFLAG
ncbi:alpha/beta fold hydrolase [Niabella soli]|uniref:Alpha/beta hydrolase n=1 Tax=Niabella soli DSM 19437 TaxID=929713 RepID=W0F0V3_9BACT|nr:alpha/beta hydrolase [Niabella soli]AHF15463.1 alpha/beta hydrolase [Niabella soli DSM 19437]